MNEYTYDAIADEGIHTVGRIFNRDFGWAFRPQPIADLGIDAHVEVCQDGKPVGKILALQIKSGESYFHKRARSGYVYRGSPRHLEYWLNYPLPVALILYNPATEQVYWQAVIDKNVKRTSKGWRIILPDEQNLTQTAKSSLLAFIDGSADVLDEGITNNFVSSTIEISTNGEVLRENELRKLLEDFVANVKREVDVFTKHLWDNQILLSDWQMKMMSLIKNVFICQYAAAKGGFKSVSEIEWQRLTPILRQQFKSLMGFALDLEKGRYSEDELQDVIERASLFIECSTIAFESS